MCRGAAGGGGGRALGRIDVGVCYTRGARSRRWCGLYIFFTHIYFPAYGQDKPWSQVSSLLPPGSCLQFLSPIGFRNPTARPFFIECC